MAKPKTPQRPSRPTGTEDFFVRLDKETANQFRAKVAYMQPKTSKSAVLAMLVAQWLKAD